MSDGGTETKAAAAAVAEVKDEPVVGNFRGVALQLPPKLPGTLTLDLAEMAEAEDDQEQLAALWRILKSVLGTQVRAIRSKVAEDGDTLENVGELLTELLETVTKPYAVTPGESSASPKSSESTGD